MASSKSRLLLFLFSVPFLLAVPASSDEEHGSAGGRVLMSFKETTKGSNVSFDCAPSGPCVACLYSEKGDEKYRCSETGYRIPFKCVEMPDSSKSDKPANTQKTRSTAEDIKPRSLLSESSTEEGGSQAYITYRSCIPPDDEERLSVVGFESVVLFLLMVSGSAVYFRRKKTMTMAGVSAGRSNSRF